MSVSLSQWSQYLNRVTPNDSTLHPLICIVQEKGEQKKYKVLSEDEYNNFYNNHSSVDSCRKLSLNEIIFISKQCLPINDTMTVNMILIRQEMAIIETISLGNIFLTDAHKTIMSKLKFLNSEISQQINFIDQVSDSLEKMANRSLNKRINEKITGIWGKIKWFIWSYFFDTRHQIKEIKAIKPLLIASQSQIKETAQEAIKERILINIQGYENEMNINGNMTNENDNFYSFDTPAAVRKNWLVKNSSDKIGRPLTEPAKQYEQRIVAMLKIWDEINKLVLNPSSVKPIPSSSSPDSKNDLPLMITN